MRMAAPTEASIADGFTGSTGILSVCMALVVMVLTSRWSASPMRKAFTFPPFKSSENPPDLPSFRAYPIGERV
jgi:hypothetical protein